MIQFRRKLQDVMGKPAVPITIMMATDHGDYRKPRPGMWNYIVNHPNDGAKPEPKDCMFVGDAAGRVRAKRKIPKAIRRQLNNRMIARHHKNCGPPNITGRKTTQQTSWRD